MSLFSSLLGGGGPNVSGLQKKQSNLIERNNALAESIWSGYQDDMRSGAYDPAAQLAQLQADTDYQSRMQQSNAAGAARTLGYRAGDSEPLVRMRDMSERASLDYSRLANQIREQATDRGSAALSRAAGGASSIYGQGIGAYGDQIRTGLAQQAQSSGLFGTLLGTAMPFLGGLGKSRLPRGVQGPNSYTPFLH